MRKVRISVRRLVEFVRRSGSIDNRMTSSDRALEGTKIHQLLQKKSGRICCRGTAKPRPNSGRNCFFA